MSGTNELTLVISVGVIAALLGFIISSLRNRYQVHTLKEKYVALNNKLDKQKSETSERFSSVEKVKDDLEATLSSLSPEEHMSKIPLADRDKFATAILEPLEETLKSADQQMQRIATEGNKGKKLIDHQLNMLKAPQQMGRGSPKGIAKNLGEDKDRKHWSINTLKHILEITEMKEHYQACDFTPEQQEGEGNTLPPFTINMADGKLLAVDPNAPLEPYINVCEAPDASVRTWHLETHARKLRERVMAMSSRAYTTQFDYMPDLLVLLILNDHYLTTAMEIDEDLTELAESVGVIFATPTDLMNLLQSMAFTWQQQQFSRDAERIRETGLDLYTHFGTFVKLIADLGEGLSGVFNSYNRAVNYLDKEPTQGDEAESTPPPTESSKPNPSQSEQKNGNSDKKDLNKKTA